MSTAKRDAIIDTFKEHEVSLLTTARCLSEGIDLPEELIPEDAMVEIEAKKAAGYFTQNTIKDVKELGDVKGRNLF